MSAARRHGISPMNALKILLVFSLFLGWGIFMLEAMG